MKFLDSKTGEVKSRVWFFWGALYIFLLSIFLFGGANKLTFISKIIIIVLISLMSAKFSFSKDLPVIATILTIFTAIFVAFVLETSGQFWGFLVLYLVAYYLLREAFKRGLIDFWSD
ncbi:hypothetical protein HN587_02200 [Candidatus Woesearchaeota archaeon]|jgi:hypothetical protein|nr:hypothetical protein [Candidatus Woesearchaeota archaeon]